jgi:ribosomal protein S7
MFCVHRMLIIKQRNVWNIVFGLAEGNPFGSFRLSLFCSRIYFSTKVLFFTSFLVTLNLVGLVALNCFLLKLFGITYIFPCFFYLVMLDFSLFNLIKVLMVHGKQTISYGVICDCFFYLKVSFGSSYIWSALKVIEPVVEVRILRRAGRIYFVPFPLRQTRASSLARRWLIESAKKRKLGSIGHCLALELKDICLGFGSSIFKRNKNQAQALTNRGNLGFRWLIYSGLVG